MQAPCARLRIRFEQPGAERLGEGRIVYGDGEIRSCAFAGAIPRGSDFQPVEEDAMLRRVLRVRFAGRQNGDLSVEGERADAAEEAVIVAGEGSNLGQT